jgi:probable addiction module antidote protein
MPKTAKPYRTWQLEKLANPVAAASFLNASLADSPEVFLEALKKVVQARQVSKVARESGLQRETLYRSLSEQGNPTLATLSSVLSALGMTILIAPLREPARERAAKAS